MFDFLFKRKNKKFDSSLFYSYSVSEKELKVLQGANEEFKDVLLDVFEKKLAENLYELTHGKVKGEEERGVYIGVIRVYEDLINFFTRKEKKENPGYRDIMKEAV